MQADGALVQGKTILLSGWTFMPCQIDTLTSRNTWLSADVTVPLCHVAYRTSCRIQQWALSRYHSDVDVLLCSLGQCLVDLIAELISRCPCQSVTTTMNRSTTECQSGKI